MADFLIKNATVYDGVSAEGVREDVAVRGERIMAAGDLSNYKAETVINGKDLVLAPGFIDAHTHADFNPFVYPDLPNKLLQGVTTEVVGNCGMSAAPVLGSHGERLRGIWAREGVQIGHAAAWRTFAEYREALEKQGLWTNFVSLVGHGNLRSAVMGFSAQPATPTDLLEMKKMLAQAMEEGAAGISFGLIYLPGMFAAKEELVELCREAARHNGLCAFHIRNEGSGLLEALGEALEIGKEAQARIQISHLKAGGPANWDKIDGAFRLLDDARVRGLQAEADAYPYTATSAELGIILPDALYQREDRIQYFKNPAKRDEILNILRPYYEGRNMKWENIMIGATANKRYQKYEGRTIRDIARQTKKEPERFLIEILAATSFEVSAFNFMQSEDVVGRVLEQPYVAVGSDSVADGSRKPHPRAFGTFPKIFKQYVRTERRFGTGEAIRKMTSLPAEHFGLSERGQIKKGFYADLVLFNPREIEDRATYEKSNLEPAGVKWVFVNGRPVVRKGKAFPVKAGRVLKAGSGEISR